MSSEIKLKAIGKVSSTRKKAIDDNWNSESTFIELSEEFSEESFWGLEDFSHVEIIFYMDQVSKEKIEYTARHPRNNKNWSKVGIFSQRGKNRPNQLGLTVAKVIKVEGKKLYLKGLDAVDGTPVLDVKPYVKEFSPREEIHQPEWISELMKNYW